MANKQECHLEYCCGNKYKQIQQKWSYHPTIFYLASQRSSRVNIVEGKNNVKSFFWCCLRLPFLDKNCFTIKSPSKNEDVLNTKKKKPNLVMKDINALSTWEGNHFIIYTISTWKEKNLATHELLVFPSSLSIPCLCFYLFSACSSHCLVNALRCKGYIWDLVRKIFYCNAQQIRGNSQACICAVTNY